MNIKPGKIFSGAVISTICFGLIGFFISIIKDISALKAQTQVYDRADKRIENRIDKMSKQIDDIHWHLLRKNNE